MKNKNVYFKSLCLGFMTAMPLVAETTQKPDNSGVNTRDSSGKTLTAEDQSSGTNSDVELTRMIREDINERDLSSSAKNIKIISMNGEVTLRGPIDNSAERDAVYNIALNHVKKPHKVTNNLQVKR